MPASIPLLLLLALAVMVVVHVVVPKSRPVLWKVSAGLGVVMLGLLMYLGMFYAPPEAFMSNVGRILYVHVPYIWMAFIAFLMNVGCAFAYLMKKSWVTDALAESSAEVGVLFGAVGVAMGSIWARPTWGVWWDWDPRLISTTVMLLSYVGYLALRSFTEDPERRATWSAAVGILSGVSLPITYYSVRWWNSLHQVQSSTASVDKTMGSVLLWGLVTLLCFLFPFIVKRYEIARARQTAAMELPPLEAPRPEAA
ncbi:MAG: cytochrome c biogenesis protein CcsA [Archangium sp.]|nr:cytochrome c biogenesis protein CcsA [Archangium sp.]